MQIAGHVRVARVPTAWHGAHVWSALSVRRLALPALFAVGTVLRLVPYVYAPQNLGGDARIYTDAARTWLTGGDPWRLPSGGVLFAGPPPSLLIYAPGVLIPGVQYLWIGLLVVLSAATLRRLRIPLWWLAFPPLVDALKEGSSDALLLPLIVFGAGSLAPIAKVYAVIPMLGERRWREVALAAAVMLATVPILPWGTFVADVPLVFHTLAAQAPSTPVSFMLVVVGLLGLLSLGFRRSGWLAVPVLWPASQLHYAAMSIPGLTPIIAACFAVPLPGFMMVGVLLGAFTEHGPKRLTTVVGDRNGGAFARHLTRTRISA